jgi:hypothetical protein
VVNDTLRSLCPGKRPNTNCLGGWVDSRVGLERCGKSCPHQYSIQDRPAHSESLYRLIYTRTQILNIKLKKKSLLKLHFSPTVTMNNFKCLKFRVAELDCPFAVPPKAEHLFPNPNIKLKTTNFQLFATAYSAYSELPTLFKTISPGAT